MASPYKRRRSASIVQNLWVYRRLVLAAILSGLTLWFILMNNTEVSVRFPFGFGPLQTTSGMAILLGSVAGSVVTLLITTIVLTMRRFRHGHGHDGGSDHSAIPEDRPPSDYASKAKEGFPDSGWSS
jgi:uncharacterized integral membrane protein